jgi:hypothetical protein
MPPAELKLYIAINLNNTTPRNVSQKLCLAHGNIRYCAWIDVFKQSSATSSEELPFPSKYKADISNRQI